MNDDILESVFSESSVGSRNRGQTNQYPAKPNLKPPRERPELQDVDQRELQIKFMKEAIGSEVFESSLVSNAKKLLKKGIDITTMKELGAGSYGVAYDIGGGKVFKVTTDKSEAEASFSLIGKAYPNVVKVYEVFKFKDEVKSAFWPPAGGDVQFGLILEKLTPMASNEIEDFKDVMQRLDDIVGSSSSIVIIKGKPWEEFANEVMELGLANNEEAEAEDVLLDLKEFNINDMADDLHSAGIAFLDYHSGNIMKRGSEFVVIDLGMSRIAPGNNPPVLERRLLEAGEATPDIDPKKLPDDPEEHGYNEDGFKLDDRIEFQGMNIAIEQTKGSSREWHAEDGSSGVTTMTHPYGYVEGTDGVDGDAVDVYVGPDEDAEWVYVIHQMTTPEFEEFDEDKCMIGFNSEKDAKKAYLDHYDNPQFFGAMSVMTVEDFKEKLTKHRSKKITNENKKMNENEVLDPSNENDAKKILQQNAKLLAKHGYKIGSLKALGTGTQGTAFDIGGNKVLKITKDTKEAVASNKLKGDKLKYVAEVFDVFKFKNTNVYGIVQELLKPLSSSEKKDFNQKLVFTGLPVWLKRAQSWDAATESVFKYVEKHKAKGDITTPEGKRFITWADQFMDSLEKEYNVKSSWEELKSKGITFSDYQGDNLMKRGGDYVLIDIGLSDVQGGSEPNVLEKIIRETVASFFLKII